MKRIQLVDALKNIKNRWASFLSVVLIIALGTGGYFTTLSVDQSFQKTSDIFYEKGNFKDYEMISSGGIVDKDLQKIKEVEGVNDAEGVILFDGEANINNNNYKVTFISITERISKPIINPLLFFILHYSILIFDDLRIWHKFNRFLI